MNNINYLFMNGRDFSSICNELKITKRNNYNSQTNAAGDTVVDYINSKYELEIGIIPLDDFKMQTLQHILDGIEVDVGFLSPATGDIVETKCMLEGNEVEYYTIQQNKTLFKAFSFKLIEL